MVRKASKLTQKQKQIQKQVVNITLAKETKRKPVKRRRASAKGTAEPLMNYTGGFNPVYIQSGNLAEQNINPLIKTIEELKESIKSKPMEKQLVMRTPMKPLEYETGFDFSEDKFKRKSDIVTPTQENTLRTPILRPISPHPLLYTGDSNISTNASTITITSSEGRDLRNQRQRERYALRRKLEGKTYIPKK
jgi:hypothetical protein